MKYFIESFQKKYGSFAIVSLDIKNALEGNFKGIEIITNLSSYFTHKEVVTEFCSGEKVTIAMETDVPQESVLGPKIWNFVNQ